MNRKASTRALAMLLVAGLLAACTTTGGRRADDVTDPARARSLPVDGRVDVQWTDPAQFTEVRYSHNRWEAIRGNWVVQLADHLREEAETRLPAGERLDVTITDIDRAGDYEYRYGPSANSIRFMRDLYPPRMDLSFTLAGADGATLAEGTRELTDLGYLTTSTSIFGDSDPLRYDKRLIDRWIRQEFGSRDR